MSANWPKIDNIALNSVLANHSEYFYRHVCIWYSKEFNTPLHVVQTELNPDNIMLHYFETFYEKLDEEQLHTEVIKAIDPDWNQSEEEDINAFVSMLVVEELNKATKKKSKIPN
jgi:hypothetical protein